MYLNDYFNYNKFPCINPHFLKENYSSLMGFRLISHTTIIIKDFVIYKWLLFYQKGPLLSLTRSIAEIVPGHIIKNIFCNVTKMKNFHIQSINCPMNKRLKKYYCSIS